MNKAPFVLLVVASALAASAPATAVSLPCDGQPDADACVRWARRQLDYTPRPIRDGVERIENDLKDTGLDGVLIFVYCGVVKGPNVPPVLACAA